MQTIDTFITEFYEKSEDRDKLIQLINEAGKEKKQPYFFKNILFFTNERNSNKNKTLKNIEAAIEGQDINLNIFVSDEVSFKVNDDTIHIEDRKNKIDIKDESNVDTIVIARLGVQESEQCMECIKELQAWGLFVLNPIQAAKKATNKYTSSVLLERYNIPQPRFSLLTKNDISDGMDTLKKKLADIYPSIYDNSDEQNESLEYVVKILDGHGGTGVFMVTGKTILSILQAIFAIDEDRQLLLQKKEQADGGDIRVHVFTGRTKQVIMASMKRVKLDNDFRSNVSLGATAEKVELTKEQEEIALKVARISGMPWCAVDIMPLKKGSNKEIGDNVVLEFNASPGTNGISEVIGENFIKVLFNTINDVNELCLEPKSIGYIENAKFKIGRNVLEIESKFDTGNGAKASTIGCDRIEEVDGKIKAMINGQTYTFKKHGISNPTVGQNKEERITVLIDEFQVGTRKLLNVEFALVDNRNKSTKVLINRDIMSKLAYMVNPSKKHTLDNTEFDK